LCTLTTSSVLLVRETVRVMDYTISFDKSELFFALSTFYSLEPKAVRVYLDTESLS
jgi:hypothetical protein